MRRTEDNFKTNLREMKYKDGDWIQLAWDRVQRVVFMNTVTYLWIL
jgi:hypothetical protein